MSDSFTPYLNEKAWMVHRGRWTRIKNSLYRKASSSHAAYHEHQSLYHILQDYYQLWNLGPTFLLPDYTGVLIYTYTHNGAGKGPEFLIWIDTTGPNEIIFAQDLPDLLSILALLTPIVHLDILVAVYKRVVAASLLSRSRRQKH